MDKIIIECKKVSKKYKDFSLREISFSLAPGYILGVIGRNGCGKSTLIRSILGSAFFDGDIIINGASLVNNPVEYKLQIAYVMHNTPFPKHWNALDCGKIYGVRYKSFDLDKYLGYLKEFEVPYKFPIKKLSKGQQIKQQLVFAMSYDAKVYIMDEPNANLDTEFREQFYKILRKLTENEEKSVIYVSHLVEEMEHFADYILWMKDGSIEYFGTSENLLLSYMILECDEKEIADIFLNNGTKQKKLTDRIVGKSKKENHQEMLIRCRKEEIPESLYSIVRYGELKEIMYYVEKGDGIL